MKEKKLQESVVLVQFSGLSRRVEKDSSDATPRTCQERNKRRIMSKIKSGIYEENMSY